MARAAPLPKERAGLAWILPDVALVAACITLFYCLFLFQGYRQLFRDSDAGWHIVNGEEILSTGHLPHNDHYSFTRAGQPWFSWEWGSDVLVASIYRAAGLTGVALFYAALIAAGVWLWLRLHWAVDGNFFIACAMAPLLLSSENIHWLARPHVISWLFFLVAVSYCERRHGPFRWPEALAVFAFTALWANLHPSFVFAPAIALISWIGRRGSLTPFLISLVAPLLNPYGYQLYLHVFRYLTDSDLLSRIGEYQTFNFHADGSGQIIAALLLGMIGGTLALTGRRPERFLLSILLTALAVRSARVLPIAALLLLPLANASITKWLAASEPRLQAFLAYSGRLRLLDSRQNGLLLAPLVLLACFAILNTPGLRAATGFAPDQFPVAAYSHIPPAARLFATDKFGGYLIYRSAGHFSVFFDGRSDLYGAGFLRQYGRVLQVRPGWRTWWDTFHFTHALLPADSPLVPALQQMGWYTIFQDQTATLLAATGT
jgi:hypothetical protein